MSICYFPYTDIYSSCIWMCRTVTS